MQELNFETGLTEYRVNGGEVIRFHPADPKFAEKLHGLFEKLGAAQETLPEDGIFEAMEQRDKWMRGELDGVFGDGSCEKIFGNVGIYALAGGLPLWANFLMAVLDEVEKAVGSQQKLANPRVEKYMAKYAAYQKK